VRHERTARASASLRDGSGCQTPQSYASLVSGFQGAGPADVALGFAYTNYAYALQRNGALTGAPVVRETNFFVRDAYHPQHFPLVLSVSADFKHATRNERVVS